MTVLITARLRLEPFEDHHLDGLNAMNADPEVMRHPENIASVAVMKKLGMRFRGVEEWYSANDLTFEITRNEWRMRAGSSARLLSD